MAKPDCDDGWLKYAHELDAALAVADFSKGARIVLREVFAQVFGLARHQTAILSPKDIGGRSGMRPANVSRAVRELVESRVLERQDNGSFRFLKDYESWLDWRRGGLTGRPRLSPAELVYCHSAPEIAKANTNSFALQARIQRDSLQESENGERVSNGIRKTIQRDTKNYPTGYENGIPPTTPLLGREIRDKRILGADAEGSESTCATGYEDTEKGFPIRCPEHREIVEHARALFGDKAALAIAQMGRDIDDSTGGKWDCYRAALDVTKRRGKPTRDLHAMCIKLAIKFADSGIPPEPVAVDPDPQAALSGPTIAERAARLAQRYGTP